MCTVKCHVPGALINYLQESSQANRKRLFGNDWNLLTIPSLYRGNVTILLSLWVQMVLSNLLAPFNIHPLLG